MLNKYSDNRQTWRLVTVNHCRLMTRMGSGIVKTIAHSESPFGKIRHMGKGGKPVFKGADVKEYLSRLAAHSHVNIFAYVA